MYRITLWSDKKTYHYLLQELSKIFSEVSLGSFNEGEVQITVGPLKILEEESLLILNKVLDEYENKFNTDVFVEVKDLSFGEPSVDSDMDCYEIGGVVIKYCTSLENFSCPDNFIVIRTDYGFGNGKHPTTHLCIEMMQSILKNRGGINKVLDFGCGTGILSLIASKIYGLKVFAVDIDPLCVKISKKNALLNCVSDKIEIVHGSWDMVKDKFDLILCNLTPSVLIDSCYYLNHHLSTSGFAVISGFMKSHFKELKKYLDKTDLKVIRDLTKNGWMAALLIKS